MTAAADSSITWAAPFVAGQPEASPDGVLWPSERYPWTSELAQHYLDQYSQPGDVVLDPFASQPALVTASGASRRRLVLNNASLAALLGVLASASPPAPAVLDHAFSRIADAPRRGRTLAHHLAALYETVCPECAQTIVAEHFVWDRTVGEPVEKGYRCPHCGSHGPAPTDMVDTSQVASLEVRGAAYWGLLSRLVKPGDPQTVQARELQDLYPPRALLVISELLTAAEQRLNDSEDLRAGRAMILHVLARGLSWEGAAAGSSRNETGSVRPGLRPPPRRFVEHNLWLAFEHAHRVLRARPHAPLALAPDLARLRAPDGEGRVLALTQHAGELGEQLGPGAASLLLTDPPPFEPASYAWQFLWTGWLYGREAAKRQRQVLSIEQWSWDWYARAMASALRAVRPTLRPAGRLVLAFGDPSPRRGIALLAAAGAAGWRLVSHATQATLFPPASRIQWRLELAPDQPPEAADPLADLDQRVQRSAQEAVLQLLAMRAEPAPLALVQTACAVRWSELGLLAELVQHAASARRPVSYLLEQLHLALTPELPPPGLVYVAADHESQQGLWAAEQPPAQPPLADRLELFVAQRLEAGSAPAKVLANEIYAAFPGWQTPDDALVAACLASYGQPEENLLRLRDEDQPAERSADLAGIVQQMESLGRRLGFEVWVAPALHGQAARDDLLWTPANVVWHTQRAPAFAFAVVTQAVLYPWLLAPADALAGCPRYVVLPGGRAGLLDFKLRHCPPWRTRLAWTGWEFVKFRHLRELAAMDGLNLATFRARIGLDPIVTLPGQQLALFSMGDPGDIDEA